MKWELQMCVSLGHGLLPLLPLALLFVGLFFRVSFWWLDNFALDALVARLVGSVLHP